MNDLDLKTDNGGYEEKKEKIRYYLMQSYVFLIFSFHRCNEWNVLTFCRIIFCLFYIIGSCSWILVNSLFLEVISSFIRHKIIRIAWKFKLIHFLDSFSHFEHSRRVWNSVLAHYLRSIWQFIWVCLCLLSSHS